MSERNIDPAGLPFHENPSYELARLTHAAEDIQQELSEMVGDSGNEPRLFWTSRALLRISKRLVAFADAQAAQAIAERIGRAKR